TGPGTLNYYWNFGDGSSSTLKDPTHNYSKTGSYTVTLITTSNLGCSDTLIKKNLVSIGTVNSDFSTSGNLCQGNTIQFTNTSQPVPGSSVWYFGDGTTATAISPKK